MAIWRTVRKYIDSKLRKKSETLEEKEHQMRTIIKGKRNNN
jgi:hypothetical protein